MKIITGKEVTRIRVKKAVQAIIGGFIVTVDNVKKMQVEIRNANKSLAYFSEIARLAKSNQRKKQFRKSKGIDHD